MNRDQILALPDEEILKLAHQLHIAYQLKKTVRYDGSRNFDVHGESVAEHVFALLYLAQYFLPLEDPDGKLHKATVYETLLYHDFGEILNGDIPYHRKTAQHEAQEKEDALTVFASLPSPLNSQSEERWSQYENRSTPEAEFVYALDKIEPLFELLDPVSATSLRRTHFTYEMSITKKLKATEQFPVMGKFVEVISNDLKNRGVFWEEPK